MSFKSNASKPPAITPSAVGTYGGLTNTVANSPRIYLAPGHYLLRVDSFRLRTGFKGESHIATMTVVHSFSDSEPGATTVGTQVADVMKRTNRMFMPRLRGFLDAAGDLTQADWNSQPADDIVREALGDEQPLAGRVVEVRAAVGIKEGSQQKPRSELVPGVDTYVGTSYVRSIGAGEIKSTLRPEALVQFFPDIEQQVAAESDA